MSNSKTKLATLEAAFKEQDYTIRYEKGNFQSGYCIVEDKKIVIINKFFKADAKLSCLQDIWKKINLSHTVATEN